MNPIIDKEERSEIERLHKKLMQVESEKSKIEQ